MTLRAALGRSALTLAAALAGPAWAVDWTVSGFGTVGLAVSDQPYSYQRYVNEHATLKRDSVAGLQMDVKLGREFSATVQAKLAAPTGRDDGVRAGIAWGFLAWRPTNEWLLRAGKFRVPLYMHSETQDIGTTFDTATLPVEVYSQSPTTDFTGLSASRSWSTSDGEVVADVYWGRARTQTRSYGRFDLSSAFGDLLPSPPVFLPMKASVQGFALTLRQKENVFRAALMHARLESLSPLLFVDRYPFVEISGLQGVGYYDTLDGVGLGRVPVQKNIDVPVVMLGADIGGPLGTRIAAEFGRRIVKRTLGYDSKGAYVSVRRRWGSWTPYLTLARLRSTDGDLAEFAAVDTQRVSAELVGAALAEQIGLLQQAGADGITVFDQTSVALGTSLRLTSTSMLKAEWQRVRVGRYSALIDPPPGVTIQHQRINLFSLSYSVVF